MASGSNAQMVVTIAVLTFGLVMESPESPESSKDAQVGVCFGQFMGNNLPPAAEVVELYGQHNITRMRMYYPHLSILQALRGSKIELTLDVPREDIPKLASNESTAADWVQSNLLAYWPDVRFRYIVVGSGIIPDPNLSPYILHAMRNIYGAISVAGLQNHIKVSTAVRSGDSELLNRDRSFRPSAGSFRPSFGEFTIASRAYMEPIVQFLNRTGAPLLANIYPFFIYHSYKADVSLAYAQFTAPGTVVEDQPYSYQNLFDAMLDSLHAALEKVGGPNVTIVVSETGWPSAGTHTAATISNAQAYNRNLIQHASGGTPRRPGRAIETYVFSMFNENQQESGQANWNFGLFHRNKQPVYPISF